LDLGGPHRRRVVNDFNDDFLGGSSNDALVNTPPSACGVTGTMRVPAVVANNICT
jgi:hypothetical protein